MPIKKKANFRIFLTWTIITVLIILMLVSFPATQHMTEIVVYP